MNVLRIATAAIVLFGSSILAGGALAAPNVVDQYTEQVPTPGGEKPGSKTPPLTDQAGSNDPNDGAANSATTAEDGSLEAPVSGNGKADSSQPGQMGQGNSSQGPSETASAPGSFVEGLAESGSNDNMGIVFPLLLVGALAGVIAVVFARRSRSQAQAD